AHEPSWEIGPRQQIELVIIRVVALAHGEGRAVLVHLPRVAVLGKRDHRPEADRLHLDREVTEEIEGLTEVRLLLEVHLGDEVEEPLYAAFGNRPRGVDRALLVDRAVEV